MSVMSQSQQTGDFYTFPTCPYCGNSHTYSAECCRDIRQKANSTQPPLMVIPDNKDQLQQIIDLLKEIKYNTDRLRVK
jgi:hypothetical protein